MILYFWSRRIMPNTATSNVCHISGSYYNFSLPDHGFTTPFNLQFSCSLNPLPPPVTPPIFGDCPTDPTPSLLTCLLEKFSITSHHLQVRQHIASSSSSLTPTCWCLWCQRFRGGWWCGFHHRWVELRGGVSWLERDKASQSHCAAQQALWPRHARCHRCEAWVHRPLPSSPRWSPPCSVASMTPTLPSSPPTSMLSSCHNYHAVIVGEIQVVTQ